MPRVLNKKTDRLPLGDTVYIGRPSVWGNPYRIGPDGTREEVIEKFSVYLFENIALVEKVKTELKGKDLVCYCAPEPCHGDVLLRVANIEEV